MKSSLSLPTACLIVGIGAGFLINQFLISKNFSPDVEIHGGGGSYTFINPLLECDLGPDYISKNAIVSFKPEISDLIDKEKTAGNITY